MGLDKDDGGKKLCENKQSREIERPDIQRKDVAIRT